MQPPYTVPAEGSLGLLALGARGLWAWRSAREGAAFEQPPTPNNRGRRKVLLIGWDAADWRVIRPLMNQGLMPTLRRLVHRGASGNLATLDPPLSPMLWTSIATGKTADQHGILGFVEPAPGGEGVRPVHGTSRKCKAVWNILNQEGYRSHIVGWWPSHPAEPIDGVAVSNFYHRATAPLGEPWPLALGAVHPSHLEETFAALRVHPAELTAAHILPFVPRAAELDEKEQQRRLGALAKIIADAASVHAAATYAMEFEPWDFTAVYFDAIDHFGHAFMKFHPPRKPGVPEDLFEQFRGVITAGYRLHDMMLEHLLALAGEDTTVLLISDHGFHPDHLRPRRIPREPAGPAAEHREHGIVCMAGPRVARDTRLYGASLLDIAPTVLHCFGLPVGLDMKGRVLQAFRADDEPHYVESWETIEGDDGRQPEAERPDPRAEREAMKQLVALGYIEPMEGDAAERIARAERESQYYLARVLINQSRHEEALPLLQAIYEAAPDELRYGVRLAHCYLQLGRLQSLRRTVERLEQDYERLQAERLEKLRAALKEAEGEGEEEKAAALRRRMENHDAEPHPGLYLLRAALLTTEKHPQEALEYLLRAEAADPHQPGLHVRLGEVYLQQDRPEEAERALLKALTIDPDTPDAHHLLAKTYAAQGRLEEAAEAALRAVGLRHFFPAAHFRLGHVLMQLGYHREAAQAFEVCVQQAPGFRRAHTWLSELYRIYLGDPARAQQHLRFATEQIVPPDPAT